MKVGGPPFLRLWHCYAFQHPRTCISNENCESPVAIATVHKPQLLHGVKYKSFALFFFHSGPPESLMLSYMDQHLCFNSSVHPAYPAEYLVNITDVTSSLIFRHIYNTSQCLENFYLCGEGPFTVSVTARNRFEETSISQQLDIGIGNYRLVV